MSLRVVLSTCLCSLVAPLLLLAQEGEVQQLIAKLGHADARQREQAAAGLAALGPAAKEAVGPLSERLTDDDPAVRAHAAYALGQIGEASKPATNALTKAIVDPDQSVRRAVVGALEQIRPGPDVMLPLLVKVLEENDPAIVLPALRSMAEAGAVAVPGVIEALKNERSCYWACLVAAEIGPAAKDAVPALAEIVDNPEPETRLQALMALGEIGADAKSASSAVLKALDDDFISVRYGAAFAVGRIGVAEADPVLRKLRDSDDDLMRLLASWALAKNNPTDPAVARHALQEIVAGIKSEDQNIRIAAARALAEIEPPAGVADSISEEIQNADPEFFAVVVEVLAPLGAKAVPAAVRALERPLMKPYAARLIARIGPEAEEAVGALVETLKDGNPEVRREVQFALAAIGPAAAPAVSALIESLSDEVDEVQYSACYALGKIGPAAAQQATRPLVAAVQGEDEFLKMAGVWALLQVRPNTPRLIERAVPLLIEGLSFEKETARVEAATTLGELGAAAKSAVPALEKALNDRSRLVRDAAAAALEQIGN